MCCGALEYGCDANGNIAELSYRHHRGILYACTIETFMGNNKLVGRMPALRLTARQPAAWQSVVPARHLPPSAICPPAGFVFGGALVAIPEMESLPTGTMHG